MQIDEYLDHYAAINPELAFVQHEQRVLTYKEASAEVSAASTQLQIMDLKRGDRFAVLSKNSVESYLSYFVASRAGAVAVPLNFRLNPKEWIYILEDSECKLLIVDEHFRDPFNTVRSEFSGEVKYVSEVFASWQEQPNEPNKPNKPNRKNTEQNPRTSTLSVSLEDPLIQMYTSGTTGMPKGVIISQRALLASIDLFTSTTQTEESKELTLVCAPLFHVAAAVSSLAAVTQGNSILIHADFSPDGVVTAVSKQQVTRMLVVPVMIQACISYLSAQTDADLSSVKSISYGASAISETVLTKALELFACNFFQAYGMTETTGIATILDAEDHLRAINDSPHLLLSAGRPAMDTEIKIVDSEGVEVAEGDIGEILIRGPQLMTGYWKRKPLDDKGGWLRTGDAAFRDQEGYLYIRDRINDMIISGGENIYPVEVESILMSHPKITDAAVIGIPSDQWGEIVHAIVVREQNSELTEEELTMYCKDSLAGYKCPKAVDFVDALPRNAAGKVLKKDLREPHWNGRSRRIG